MQVESLKAQIKKYLRKHSAQARNRTLNDHDHLLKGGILDSLGVLDLVAYLEQEFLISVSDEDLVPENFQTIQCLAAFVLRKRKWNGNTDATP